MGGDLVFTYYLLGTHTLGPRSESAASVEIPCVYSDEQEARNALGGIMMLSRMAHGDAVAEATSWYLLTAIRGQGVAARGGDHFFAYELDGDEIRAVAGGFPDIASLRRWEPFVVEVEFQRARRAGLPWKRSLLDEVVVSDTATDASDVDCEHLRFAPFAEELLVRPLELLGTELLF